MHTTNWIVSFNSIMNTSERNKQTTSPAHLYDSFTTTWQVSVRKEFGILKAAPMRPAENIRLAHKEVFSPLSLHVSPILIGGAVQDKSTNPSGLRLWLYVNGAVFQLAGATYLSGLKVPGRSNNLGSWRHLS